jgi:hypothetical protein
MAKGAADVYDKMDEDHDGVLSPEEFEKAFNCGLLAPHVESSPSSALAQSALVAARAVQQGTATSAQASSTVADAAVAAALAKQEAAKHREGAADAILVPPEFQKSVAEAEKRIATALEMKAKLEKDRQRLLKENVELKQVVSKARVNAERSILKKRADNVQMLADNAELERFTLEARRLAEQKAKLAPSKSITGCKEYDALQQSNNIIRRKLDRLLSQPQRMPLGVAMESPRSTISSLEATPRIDAALEWRANLPMASGPG